MEMNGFNPYQPLWLGGNIDVHTGQHVVCPILVCRVVVAGVFPSTDLK
jgi:hypothetical protein